jgi:hypothetical protein
MTKIWLILPALCLLPLAEASAQVPGSYRQSCRNISQNGGALTAECKAPGGQWLRSTLDLNRCGGQGVANNFGRLSCGNAQGSASPVRRRDDGYGDGGYDNGQGGPRYRKPGYAPQNDYGDEDYAPPRPRRYYSPDDDE